VNAEMLTYTTATNLYYFPVVIVPVLVLWLRLSTKVSKFRQGQQVQARSAACDTQVQLTQ